MKKLTKQMERNIVRCAKLYDDAHILEEKIRMYLYENNIDLHTFMVDCLQFENDADGLISFLNGNTDSYGNNIRDFIVDDIEKRLGFDDIIT